MSLTNFSQFIGNLTKNPEGRTVQIKGESKRVLNFSIAVNTYRPAKGKEPLPPTYVDLEVWDKAAEVVEANLVKGDRILVQGEYRVDMKETNEGNRRYHKFRVVDFEIVKCKKWQKADEARGENDTAAYSDETAPAKKTKPAPKPQPEPEGDDDDDGIPF